MYKGERRMKNRFSSIRFSYIISHLNGFFLTLITILAVLLSIYVWFSPEWLTSNSIFLFIGLYSVIAFVVSVYVGFRSSGDLKQRMDYLSVLITQLANGNYQSKIYF